MEILKENLQKEGKESAWFTGDAQDKQALGNQEVPGLALKIFTFNIFLMIGTSICFNLSHQLCFWTLFLYSGVGSFIASRCINKKWGKKQPIYATVLNALGYALLVSVIASINYSFVDPYSNFSLFAKVLSLFLSVTSIYGVFLVFKWRKIGLPIACGFFFLSILSWFDDSSEGDMELLLTVNFIITSIITIIYTLNLRLSGTWKNMTWEMPKSRYFYVSWIATWIIYSISLASVANFKENKTKDSIESYGEDIYEETPVEEEFITLDEEIADAPDGNEDIINNIFVNEVEPNIAKTNFKSKDRQTFNLNGPVKTVELYSITNSGEEILNETLNFNKEGKIVFDDNTITISRNKSGFISEIKYDFGGTTYYYDNDNRILSTTNWDTSSTTEKYIERDKLGNPQKSRYYGEGYAPDTNQDNTYYATSTYKYYGWDQYGNWTMRKQEYKENGNSHTSGEKRVIRYY